MESTELKEQLERCVLERLQELLRSELRTQGNKEPIRIHVVREELRPCYAVQQAQRLLVEPENLGVEVYAIMDPNWGAIADVGYMTIQDDLIGPLRPDYPVVVLMSRTGVKRHEETPEYASYQYEIVMIGNRRQHLGYGTWQRTPDGYIVHKTVL